MGRLMTMTTRGATYSAMARALPKMKKLSMANNGSNSTSTCAMSSMSTSNTLAKMKEILQDPGREHADDPVRNARHQVMAASVTFSLSFVRSYLFRSLSAASRLSSRKAQTHLSFRHLLILLDFQSYTNACSSNFENQPLNIITLH